MPPTEYIPVQGGVLIKFTGKSTPHSFEEIFDLKTGDILVAAEGDRLRQGFMSIASENDVFVVLRSVERGKWDHWGSLTIRILRNGVSEEKSFNFKVDRTKGFFSETFEFIEPRVGYASLRMNQQDDSASSAGFMAGAYFALISSGRDESFVGPDLSFAVNAPITRQTFALTFARSSMLTEADFGLILVDRFSVDGGRLNTSFDGTFYGSGAKIGFSILFLRTELFLTRLYQGGTAQGFSINARLPINPRREF